MQAFVPAVAYALGFAGFQAPPETRKNALAFPPRRRTVTTDPNASFSSRRSGLSSVSLPPIQTIGGWFGPRLRPELEGIAGSAEADGDEGDDTPETLGDGREGWSDLVHPTRSIASDTTRATMGSPFAYDPFFTLMAAVISGRTFSASPTMPRSAY